MKATNSKDGKLRFTINISYRIDAWDLVTLLARARETQDEIPETRHEILKAMREGVQDYGRWNCGSLDEVSRENIEATKVTIGRLFPELTMPESVGIGQ